MAGQTELTLNALQKEVYANGGLNKLMPETRYLMDKIPFDTGDAIGDKYIQPVQLSHSHGFSTGVGAFSLSDSVGATFAEAQVRSVPVLLRESLAYEAAHRMSTSKKAFIDGSAVLYSTMMDSHVHRLEVLMRYGGRSLGKVATAAAGVITIAAADWASGIWQALEGATLEAFTALTGGVQHNADLVITAIDIEARTITVSGTSAAVAAGDFLFYKGFRGSEMIGIDQIATNTGILHNIDAAQYGLWRSSSYGAGSAALTMPKILSAAAKSSNRGCKEELILLCSNLTFGNLNADQAALRSYDTSYSKTGENGFEELKFKAQNGLLTVVGDSMIKEGEAFMFPVKRMKRIGATDLTFKRPGRSDDQVWLELPSNAGYEVRSYSSFGLYCERPAYVTKITGIVNV
jgi:hypothetical protein